VYGVSDPNALDLVFGKSPDATDEDDATGADTLDDFVYCLAG
jgi:hypothetical protein